MTIITLAKHDTHNIQDTPKAHNTHDTHPTHAIQDFHNTHSCETGTMKQYLDMGFRTHYFCVFLMFYSFCTQLRKVITVLHNENQGDYAALLWMRGAGVVRGGGSLYWSAAETAGTEGGL